MSTSSGWWSGRLGWSAVLTMWRARATSGFLPSVWRTRGCSVCTSSCGRSTCPNTAPLPWDTPGPMLSRDYSCCCHWLTPSMWKNMNQTSFQAFWCYLNNQTPKNVLRTNSSCHHFSTAALWMLRRPARQALVTATSHCGATTWFCASGWLSPASCPLVTSEFPHQRSQPPHLTAVSHTTTRCLFVLNKLFFFFILCLLI